MNHWPTHLPTDRGNCWEMLPHLKITMLQWYYQSNPAHWGNSDDLINWLHVAMLCARTPTFPPAAVDGDDDIKIRCSYNCDNACQHFNVACIPLNIQLIVPQMQYQEKTALPKGGAKTISDIDIKSISFVCALLWKYNQEEAWANNNWADVNCAVAIVSMAISMVSSGGATVKSFRAIRCRLLSPGSNPIHFTTNDYI